MAPQARIRSSVVVAGIVESLLKEFIGNIAILQEAVYTLCDLEVDPDVVAVFLDVLFLGKLFRNVLEANMDVFGVSKQGVEIEDLDIKGGKLGTGSVKETVDNNIGGFKGAGGCAAVSRVANAVATNGHMGAVGRGLLGLDFTHHLSLCDILAVLGRDVFVFDDVEIVGARYALPFSVLAFSYALAEAINFISMGSAPGFRECRIFAEMVIYEHPYRGLIEDSQRQHGRRGCGKDGCTGTSVGLGTSDDGFVSIRRRWWYGWRGVGCAEELATGNRAIHQRGVGRHGVCQCWGQRMWCLGLPPGVMGCSPVDPVGCLIVVASGMGETWLGIPTWAVGGGGCAAHPWRWCRCWRQVSGVLFHPWRCWRLCPDKGCLWGVPVWVPISPLREDVAEV